MDELRRIADEYGTPREREIAHHIVDDCLNYAEIAELLGITQPRVRSAMSTLRARAARAGHHLPEKAPSGFSVRKCSTQYDEEGNIRQRWVTVDRDKQQKIDALAEAVQVLAEPFRGVSFLPPHPVEVMENLLAVYAIGDPHLGMYAWAAEAGEDFDLSIAERDLYGGIDYLVDRAPPAQQALIVNAGDFYHADNSMGMTMRSGHMLDVDSRYSKVYEVGIKCMQRIINRALEKHETVSVICEIGNHDDHSALTLALCLREHYSNNPRVQVDTNPSVCHWYRFGDCIIGTTHGNNHKLADLPSVMATERPTDWGECTHRHWYTGHVHHDQTKEYRGCTVETLRTLAARDAWAASKGYHSGRDIKLDVWHRKYGRVSRYIGNVQQIRDRQQGVSCE